MRRNICAGLLGSRDRYPISFRHKMSLPGIKNVVNEPEFPKPQNNQAIDVDLVPGVRKVGVPRKLMMVVVQSFTEGEDRGHQLVGRAIIELEATVTVF